MPLPRVTFWHEEAPIWRFHKGEPAISLGAMATPKGCKIVKGTNLCHTDLSFHFLSCIVLPREHRQVQWVKRATTPMSYKSLINLEIIFHLLYWHLEIFLSPLSFWIPFCSSSPQKLRLMPWQWTWHISAPFWKGTSKAPRAAALENEINLVREDQGEERCLKEWAIVKAQFVTEKSAKFSS